VTFQLNSEKRLYNLCIFQGKLVDWPHLPPPPLDAEEEELQEEIHVRKLGARTHGNVP
jgi:hypothetical protein